MSPEDREPWHDIRPESSKLHNKRKQAMELLQRVCKQVLRWGTLRMLYKSDHER